MVEELIKSMQVAIRELDDWGGEQVHLFHHNDSDGLSSGALLKTAFERKGYTVKRTCLEKPYPALLKKIYEHEGRVLVFADFAGRIAPLLSDLNRGRNLTLILDHHVAEASTDPRVHNLDPTLYGIKGDRDMTGSVTCYLFATAMDPRNADLAPVAAIGAVGDKFFVDGCLVGQNREVVQEAVAQGMMEIRAVEGGERYYIRSAGTLIPCDELGDDLDVLGGAGYYGGGPEMGIQVCLEGASPASRRMLEELSVVRKRIFAEEIARLKNGGLIKTPHIQWCHVGERFKPMGVKMIGIFCETLLEMDFVDPKKYIAGFQVIPNEIPGVGPIHFDEVKISMRVAPFMQEEIRSGRAMGLNTFLPEATGRLGGFSDACHTLTAATTVAIGKEEALVAEMEKILANS